MTSVKFRIALAIMLTTLTLMTAGCGDDKNVTLVKKGTMQMEPNIEIGKAFDKFFGNPKWKSFKSTDNQQIVEFNGDCTWNDRPAKCKMQFIILNNERFELHYVGINGNDMTKLEGSAIMHKALTGRDDWDY